MFLLPLVHQISPVPSTYHGETRRAGPETNDTDIQQVAIPEDYKSVVKAHDKNGEVYNLLPLDQFLDADDEGLALGISGSDDRKTADGYVPEYFVRPSFPIVGQGIFGIQYKAEGPFRLILSEKKQLSEGKTPVLVLEITETGAVFRKANNSSEDSILGKDQWEAGGKITSGSGRTTRDEGSESIRIKKDKDVKYWFSIDKENQLLRYGRGYQTTALTLLEVDLRPNPLIKGDQGAWETWMSKVEFLAIADGNITTQGVAQEHVTDIWPFAVGEIAPVIVTQDELTLDQLEKGTATVVENLPLECQQLYANVAGKGILLNTPDFPDFSAAIQHSVSTPGCAGYNKLKHKSTEFAKEPNLSGTYLRITLGQSKGNSPGCPYVMEIWPAGHYSPVHNHSDTFAVIKVLHGKITCRYYASLDPQATASQYYRLMTFCEGAVTWLSRRQLQTHQLHNESEDVCVTIQCYQYANDDKLHYEYFDWIDEDGKKIGNFKPNSDWTLGEFREVIREEWAAYKKEQKRVGNKMA